MDNSKKIRAFKCQELEAENEKLRQDLLSGAPAYYERWKESEAENKELIDAVVEETLKVRHLKSLLRRAVAELESFPHPEKKKKNCETCKLVKEIKEALK